MSCDPLARTVPPQMERVLGYVSYIFLLSVYLGQLPLIQVTLGSKATTISNEDIPYTVTIRKHWCKLPLVESHEKEPISDFVEVANHRSMDYII